MTILLITSSYPPEIRSSSHLMQELAEELAIREHKVIVATTYPKCNLAEKLKGNKFKKYSTENNIDVIRINTPLPPHQKTNFMMRGISHLVLPYLYFFYIKKYIKKKKIGTVIVYSPPLTLAILGEKIKKTYVSKFILNIQDIFPQNAIDLGVLKNSFFIKLFERIEKRAYRNADIIAVHSSSNRKFLIREKNLPPHKVSTMYNWIDSSPCKKPVESDRYRKKYGLEKKFIFFFGGVMGPSQGLDLIIDAARELRRIDDLTILLVGDGLEKEKLQGLVRDNSLENVVFQNFVSKEDYRTLLAEIDVGLVCLSAANKTPVVPGKILSYMAAAVPVLAFLNKESDGIHIIRQAKCGYSEVSDNARKAANMMLNIYKERDKLPEYGKNGFNFATAHFSKKICVDKLEGLLK